MQRPIKGQKAYYNGYKKYYTVDCLMVHDGNGKACNLVGPQPGSRSDTNIWYDSYIYKNKHKHLLYGHNIIASYIWFGIIASSNYDAKKCLVTILTHIVQMVRQ